MNILNYEFIGEYEKVLDNKIKYYLYCSQKGNIYEYFLGFNLMDQKKLDKDVLVFENYQKVIEYLNNKKEINIDELFNDNCDDLKKIRFVINVTKQDNSKYCENDGIKISYIFEKKKIIKISSQIFDYIFDYIFGNCDKIEIDEMYYNSNYINKIKENGYEPKISTKITKNKMKINY